jgi:hypothetical protein
MAISLNTVVPALIEVHANIKILPITIPVIKSLTVCLIVEPAFTYLPTYSMEQSPS